MSMTAVSIEKTCPLCHDIKSFFKIVTRQEANKALVQENLRLKAYMQKMLLDGK